VTDYEALVAESNPDVPGAHVRLALLRRGAELERERIVALLEEAFMSQNYSWDWDEPAPRKMDTKWVRFRGDVLALIKGEAK
jgi:hypothetical protein